MATDNPAHGRTPIDRAVLRLIAVLERTPVSLVSLLARLSMAGLFWQSARTKVESGTLLTLSSSATMLFAEEFRLPVLPPEVAAHLALYAETLLPILLVLGFASRFAALGLIAMTLVIQIFVYPDAWPTHGTWIAALAWIVVHGPGFLSVDALVRRSRPV